MKDAAKEENVKLSYCNMEIDEPESDDGEQSYGSIMFKLNETQTTEMNRKITDLATTFQTEVDGLKNDVVSTRYLYR